MKILADINNHIAVLADYRCGYDLLKQVSMMISTFISFEKPINHLKKLKGHHEQHK